MNINTGTVEKKPYARLLDIPGLVWRSFRGEEDYPRMLKVMRGCADADGLERSEQLADVANDYAHLHNCDPYTDMLFAEVAGEVVAYSRVWRAVEGSGTWIGFQQGNVLPQWRQKGIGSALMQFNEERLHQIALQLKQGGQISVNADCLLDNFVMSSETDRNNLIEKHGYQAVRYEFEMVRPDLENIPDRPMPPGIEVRPVAPEHLRPIWEAANDAFRDHWGYIPDPWEEYERVQSDPDYDPSLWQVAWHDVQVVGMVMCFIDRDQNEIYGRKRGYTENICVRKAWRKQGLASALIVQGLKALKERGMTEAGLGVDSENTSGALHLYESLGYRVVKRATIYRKQITA